ncbi:MAG: phage holin family protein [Flavobacteriales bacterium]|nr:phage holin family protein [Flavobacteriales bacterium]
MRVFAAVLGLLNALLKPLLILFTLPVTVLTLGLFLLVINAVIVLIADQLIDGFMLERPKFWWALGNLCLDFVQRIPNAFDGGKKREVR